MYVKIKLTYKVYPYKRLAVYSPLESSFRNTYFDTMPLSDCDERYLFSSFWRRTAVKLYPNNPLTVRFDGEVPSELPCGNEAVSVKKEGPVEIIPDGPVSLRDASGGFYIKSCGKKGNAKITVTDWNGNESVIKMRASLLRMRGFFYFCGIKTKSYAKIQMSTAGGYRYGESHHFL